MSNIYLNVKYLLQLTQISLNFKTSCFKCVVCYIIFERKNNALKSKSTYFLLNKNINFHKSDMELKKENPKQSFRETNLVFQLI